MNNGRTSKPGAIRRRNDKRVEVKCDFCGSPLWVSPSAIDRNKRHFCNRACRSAGAKKVSYIHGYTIVELPNRKRVSEHRLIAEKLTGRPLSASDVVHHANEIRSDNRPTNLVVMSRSDHTRHHHPLGWSIEDAIAMNRDGISIGEIAERFGVLPNSIAQAFKRAGIIPTKNPPITKNFRRGALHDRGLPPSFDTCVALRLFLAGHTCKYIAEQVGVRTHTVDAWLSRQGFRSLDRAIRI